MEGSKKGNNTRVLRNQKLEFPILAIFKFDVCFVLVLSLGFKSILTEGRNPLYGNLSGCSVMGAYFYYVDRQGGRGGQKNAYFTK